MLLQQLVSEGPLRVVVARARSHELTPWRARVRMRDSYLTSPNTVCGSSQSVVLCGANDRVWYVVFDCAVAGGHPS